MSATITKLRAREILDSRGRPTVEAEIGLSDGTTAIASVPSGASTGAHEALERRDGDPSRYRGLGVLQAVRSLGGEVADALAGTPADLAQVDRLLIEMDGTPDKSRLGANATLAVSLATARAAAVSAGVPLWQYLAGDRKPLLPLPMVNILSGGLHARRGLDFQDFLVIPVGAENYSHALEMAVQIHDAMANELDGRGLSTLRADEGGFGPALPSHGDALRLLDDAVTRAGFELGTDVVYALDVAATHFYDADSATYRLDVEQRAFSAEELGELISEFARRHAIASVEDPFAEDDWPAWAAFTKRAGRDLQIIGDDLFTTNPERVAHGRERGAANAILVKMNQIGTLSETLAVVNQGREASMRLVISARSGETEDPALADLAVATRAGQIKIGSVTQSERLAKYNQLLRIEDALGADAEFAGRAALARPT
jgi:enolase 1/2/3